jgi:hypothetical protein
MRDRRIDLETLEEIPQALKEVKKGIVTRRDPTSSLESSYITGELIRECIKGTNREEYVDSNEQCLCWWEGDLTRSQYKSYQTENVT